MEYVKNHTKILVKDENGRIVQVIPETEASSVMMGEDTVADRIEDLESGKADTDHGHVIADVDSLQSALDGKNPLIDDVSNEDILNLLNS